MSCNECIQRLIEDNGSEDTTSAIDILIKIASNVIDNPCETKYRKIRISNPLISKNLLNISGGIECLFGMGFKEDGEFLTLPTDSSLDNTNEMLSALKAERNKLKPAVSVSYSSEVQPHKVNEVSESEFLAQIKSGMNRVLFYENTSAREKARGIIPILELTSEAERKLQLSENPIVAKSELNLNDYLLVALLRWFKMFFSWVDTLPCHICNGKTKNAGGLQPTSDELRWGANRVEAHSCTKCGQITRFPRYTDASKLLDTRRGRCGEWADCFTLCCRALDFEARFVMDWTDHVWTEIYSTSQSRYLHCDPCENVCDKPLLYEAGWGKKLTYVIAVSKDEVQDVTWRYTSKHQEVLQRRNLCRESWLVKTIHSLWKSKCSSMSETKKTIMQQRLVKELVEFVSIKNCNETLPGRKTGSLAWREARGELGKTDATSHTITLSDMERTNKLIHISYNSAQDCYIRNSCNNEKQYGWSSMCFTVLNIFRKEELDWKMCYLARLEGSPSGEISWKIDVTGSDLFIDKVEIKAASETFENGKVKWEIKPGNSTSLYSGESLCDLTLLEIPNKTSALVITARMSGGQGDTAWQHTQLFRQSLTDHDSFPFEIKIKLK